MTTKEIIDKLWNLCNVLRDDGITYQQYVTELTYLLFLKMMEETGKDGTLPEGWKWVRLGEVAEISKEKTDDIARYKAWPYVGLENMETGQGIISCADAGSVKSTKNLFHIGDVLYGKLRPYLNKHDVATYEGICSTDILVFKVSDKVDSHYLNQYLNQREFINYAV